MTLQWTAVALFLYVEIGIIVILCLPFISARRWQSIFQLRIWSWMSRFWNKVFLTMIIILVVLFLEFIYSLHDGSDGSVSMEYAVFYTGVTGLTICDYQLEFMYFYVVRL
uniref:Endoplasmic reticulum transmembrane protein n=1 Tax=Amphilophus citrinellus TaxID=61819 RepID=A0A3Q0SL39_AMPCI